MALNRCGQPGCRGRTEPMPPASCGCPASGLMTAEELAALEPLPGGTVAAEGISEVENWPGTPTLDEAISEAIDDARAHERERLRGVLRLAGLTDRQAAVTLRLLGEMRGPERPELELLREVAAKAAELAACVYDHVGPLNTRDIAVQLMRLLREHYGVAGGIGYCLPEPLSAEWFTDLQHAGFGCAEDGRVRRYAEGEKPWQRPTGPTLAEVLERLRSQLPDGMRDCAILFRQCQRGHGWLTAANWADHGCPTCAIDDARAHKGASGERGRPDPRQPACLECGGTGIDDAQAYFDRQRAIVGKGPPDRIGSVNAPAPAGGWGSAAAATSHGHHCKPKGCRWVDLGDVALFRFRCPVCGHEVVRPRDDQYCAHRPHSIAMECLGPAAEKEAI